MEAGAVAAIAALVSAGAGVAGGVKAEQGRQALDNEAGREASKRADAEKQAKAQLADEEAKNLSAAEREAQKARLLASRKTGRAGTILTSPLGAPSGPTPGKTLLGA